jgi:DNA sulfur modification protein DndE
MAFDRIRLTEQARSQLGSLEKRTGVSQWPVLCRWAICLSLGTADAPAAIEDDGAGGVEMSWQQLGGSWCDILYAFLKQRCLDDGLDLDHATLADQISRHLHRGLSLLDACEISNGPEDLIKALDDGQ